MIPMSRDWFGFDGSNPRTIPKFEFFCKQWRGDCLLLFWKWTFRAIGHWQCWAEYFYRRTHREGRPIYPGWQVTTPLPPSGSRVMACNRPPPAKDTHLGETAYSSTLSITIYIKLSQIMKGSITKKTGSQSHHHPHKSANLKGVYVLISTEGALRLPTTSDNQPIQSHPSHLINPHI